MRKNKKSWVDWWKTEDITRDANWLKNMEIFVRSTARILKYKKDDTILDIGCGPCHLATCLANQVKEIHCADISTASLALCKEKVANEHENKIFLHQLNEADYTNLSFLKEKRFSIIICLSVIQYYKNKSEVEKLIHEVKKVALPGAKFLIADIIIDSGTLSQIFGLLKTGLRENYLIESLRLLWRARTSEYQDVYVSNGLLSYSEKELIDLIYELDLNATILSNQLTVNSNRKHLLINF